jgi:hypothetical protein
VYSPGYLLANRLADLVPLPDHLVDPPAVSHCRLDDRGGVQIDRSYSNAAIPDIESDIEMCSSVHVLKCSGNEYVINLRRFAQRDL